MLDKPLAALDMAHARAVMAHLRRMAWGQTGQGTPLQVFRPEVLGQICDMPLRVPEIDGKPMVLHHL